jgi:hypothetical protein
VENYAKVLAVNGIFQVRQRGAEGSVPTARD